MKWDDLSYGTLLCKTCTLFMFGRKEKVIEISFENDYFAMAIKTATSAAPPIPIQGKKSTYVNSFGRSRRTELHI
jgi:hypothetical protein